MALASSDSSPADGQFASTRWTIVLQAGNSQVSSVHAWQALSELCRIYWRPLYLFLRRNGMTVEDAQDLTQAFLADLIRDRTFRRADPEKGRFRSFLLGALKHFVADARAGAHAQKRGGGQVGEFLDTRVVAEMEEKALLHGGRDATALFDREWGAALLRQTFHRLAEECEIAGKGILFDSVRAYLSGVGDEAVPYEELSRRLHRPLGTLRSDVARLRNRYRALLREEVLGTVAEPAEVDDELRYLCQVLAQA